VKPPPPAPPPLPFKYLGKLIEDGGTQVFLEQGGRGLTAKTGEVIGGIYRVGEITATQMTLVYLPLDMEQQLAIGSAK
jgi:hypothetical protein